MRMARTLSRALIGAALAAAPLFAHAADSPARLREDEYSIESRLDVPPEIKKGSYDVHCEVRVLASGRPFGVNCYAMDPNVPRKLVEAVRAASARSLFVPAIRDGKPTQIFMLLMARIMVTKSEPLVLVLPNNGIEHKRYGLFYIAPQRLNEFSWGLPNQAYTTNGGGDILVWQELWIDEHGKVTDSRLTNASGAPLKVVNDVRASVANMQFMPGFFEGRPVPMHYIEPAYSIE
jgi:hypothetical protein